MLSIVDVPEALEKQYEANKQLGRSIATALEGKGEERLLEADVDLLAYEDLAHMYVRGAAYFQFFHSDRLLRLYSEGDFVPVGPRFAGADARITCELAADVVFFSPGELMRELTDKPDLLAAWMQYQESEQSVMYGLCARYAQPMAQTGLRLKRFEPGEVIIREGEAPEEVYCLIDGLAEARSRDVKVGEVRPTEFFGEIGFLLNQRRIASVLAVRPCTVQVLDNREFVELIRHNPQAIVSMASTLASRVVELNDRVVEG